MKKCMGVVAFRGEKGWDQGRASMQFLVRKLGEERAQKYGLDHYVSNVHVINSLVNASAIT